MSPPRRNQRAAPAVIAPAVARRLSPAREVDLLALGTVLLCALLAWAARDSLNIDGVSYLDLAQRMIAGDGTAVVQGYWSPAYSVLLAAAAVISGKWGAEFLPIAHVVNFLIAVGAILILWLLARRSGHRVFGRAVFASFLLCSARTPRLDAVTPDLLLVMVMAGVGYEMLVHRGQRWWAMGLWLGVAFLVKTSTWPWLAAAAVLLLVLADSKSSRRRVFASLALAAVLMLTWVVPMSTELGRPTLGASGALNSCWYLKGCDTRSPDVHVGEHTRYTTVVISDSTLATIASFVDDPWTWTPWSDPAAWSRGYVTHGQAEPTVGDLVVYWGKNLGFVLALWVSLLLLVVIVPIAVIHRRTAAWRELITRHRPALLCILLGVVGVAQFIAVHAEPRLIAPFVLLAALGVLWWLTDPPGAAPEAKPVDRRSPLVALASWLGLLVAVPLGLWHLKDQNLVSVHAENRLAAVRAAAHPGPGRRIAVIGPVVPLLIDAWRLERRIVAQLIRPPSATVMSWSPRDQTGVGDYLKSMGAEEVWISKVGGSFTVVRLDPLPR